MKNLLVALFIAFCVKNTKAQIVTTADSAIYYDSTLVTICDRVADTYLTKSNTTMLNFGNKYPNQSLTVVIFESDRQNFNVAPEESFKDKRVCVTGKIKLYKGKPEIIIKSPNQIKVQE